MISNWLADRLVPFFDVLAEAAWIAVVGAALDIGLAGGTTAWGPLPFAIAAAAGLIWIRRPNDPTVTGIGLFALMAGGGVIAAALQSGWPGTGAPTIELLLRQSALLLIPVAVLRGSRHRQRDEDDLVVATLLTWGIPLLVLPWILGTSVAEPLRSDFIAAAFPATVLFVSAGLLGLGLARLEALSATAPIHWRQNRSWLILLGGVVVAVTVVAIPAAFLIGTPLTQVVAGLLGPLAIILTPIAVVMGVIFVVLFAWLDPLAEWIRSLARTQDGRTPDGGALGSAPPAPPDGVQPGGSSEAVLAIAIVLGIAVLALVLIWLSRRRRPEVEGPPLPVLEEHHFKYVGTGWHLPGLRRGTGRSRGRPVTASGAYLAFLDDLADSDDLARRPHEGPAGHAGRLRATMPDWPPAAGLLAADYQLEQYAGQQLSAAETKRAVARWQRLRGLAGRRPGRHDKPPASA